MKCDICNPGLSKATEPEERCPINIKPGHICINCYPKEPKPQEGKPCLVSCPVCDWGMEDSWKFCPRDGAPRPKELSDRERLAEKLEAAWRPTAGFPNWLELADIAIKHYDSNYKEKAQEE